MRRPPVATLERSGPRLHRYPNGTYVIQFAGIGRGGRRMMRAVKLGIIPEAEAQARLAEFKPPESDGHGHGPPALPTVATVKRMVQRAPRHDVSKAILGMVASHLLNTLAHTVKLIQESDDG